jgi:hypothetical protein
MNDALFQTWVMLAKMFPPLPWLEIPYVTTQASLWMAPILGLAAPTLLVIAWWKLHSKAQSAPSE